MADELSEFVDKLVTAHGGNLKSIVLYGKAVEGGQLDDDERKKVLVVLEEITTEELKAAHEVAEWWREVGNPLPIYFTGQEIRESSDVFPIEFIGMSRVRHVVYGQDPFDDLQIHTHNLRHQLEYELRGKLIRLRSLYFPASKNPNRLTALMVDSLESFVELFKHVLEICGIDAPIEKNEVLLKIADALHLDKRIFARIAQYKKDDEVWLESETNETFSAYLRLIEQVIHAVDKQAK
ncbi:MAG: hypothetical protein AB1757_00715 [Acidobacteriota bacterium]